MDAIGYTTPYVPSVWIAAHGFNPRRWPDSTAQTGTHPPPRMGACPYTESCLAQAQSEPGFRAIVVAPLCDQMRRMADTLEADGAPPVFQLYVPVVTNSPQAGAYYRSELERLSRFLVRLGGRPPSLPDLRIRLELQQQRRPLLLSLRPPPPDGIPLALVGGPVQFGHQLLDRLESLGARVVLDATETGERSLYPALDPLLLQSDPLEALARGVLEGIPDVTRRSNAAWIIWLSTRIAEVGARGVILWRYPWCDVWQAEIRHLQEQLAVPVLDLHPGDTPSPTAQVWTRLEAFLETLT
jgi:benzoyl-CoA reductase/2-hydroxyglutaryl-CoA dehydratase subunit BcrC/BadD/HgdB